VARNARFAVSRSGGSVAMDAVLYLFQQRRKHGHA
jgi:hypothetical protein